MEDNLEIYFCEICSESIPAKDLLSREAIEVKGKVIGPCCLPAVQNQAPARSGMATAGITVLGAVLLAAIAGATVHLEWRVSEEMQLLKSKVSEVEGNVASQGSRQLTDLEKSLDQTMQKGALDPVLTKLADLGVAMAKGDEQLESTVRGVGVKLGGLDENQKQIVAGQAAMKMSIKEVESEVLRLKGDLAAAMAAPRGMPVEAASGEFPVGPVPGNAEPSVPALSPELGQQVTRLKHEDPGNRFEAVDLLVQSGDRVVLPYLLPMLKDPDTFVRRLAAEGLASFRDPTTVDALIVALADPEDLVRHTANASLRKLTKQSIAFDADGSASARTSGQRRWKDWWEKNRDSF